MSDLLAPEHIVALVAIALSTALLVVAARRWPGPWLKVLAAVLVVDEVSWWVFLLGGGQPGSQVALSLPLQLCDVAIFIAAAALWTRQQLLVEVTYFWGLAGTIQALLTPDLPQHFPSYPYFQYYIAHGGVVAAALVGFVDAVTGADYMYLRSKPPTATLLDFLGPWPWYILSAAVIAACLFAILDAPFRLRERRAEALR